MAAVDTEREKYPASELATSRPTTLGVCHLRASWSDTVQQLQQSQSVQLRVPLLEPRFLQVQLHLRLVRFGTGQEKCRTCRCIWLALGQKFVVVPATVPLTGSVVPITNLSHNTVTYDCTFSNGAIVPCKDRDDNVVLSVCDAAMGGGVVSSPDIISTDLQRQLMCGSGSFGRRFHA